MIRWRAGEFYQPTCKWCRSGGAYYTRGSQQYPHEGELLSKAEFGDDLFEAIHLQANIRQAEHTAELFRRKGLTKQVTMTEATIRWLNSELKELLKKNTIEPADLQRLLAIT